MKYLIYSIIILELFVKCTSSTKERIQQTDQEKVVNDSVNIVFDQELHFGNVFYFSEYSSNELFNELLWRQYSVISLPFNYRSEQDSIFMIKMNQYFTKKYGRNLIAKIIRIKDSLKNDFSFYLNLDSTYHYSELKPLFPGGEGYLEYLLRVKMNIKFVQEIWIDGVIDTTGKVIKCEIIRKGDPEINDYFVHVIKNDLLPFTPAYLFIHKEKNKTFYKKVLYKRRFYCIAMPKNYSKPFPRNSNL